MVSPMEGTAFGRYRLIALIGEGGMGEVWRAHDTVTDREVAIKLLPAKLSKDEDFQQRFRREAHAAARLNTPHAVPIHDYGEIDGRLFVCMRLIEGRDLATVLADGPLEPTRAVRIIEGVALALHAAHQVGLLHRDVKPSNILLDDNDFAYLIDFGIARAADDTRMTKTGNTIGTFAYIAPERLDRQGTEDARVDIYSLACVLYECLTGEPPFADDTMPRLIVAHLSEPPPRPSITQPNVPPQVDQVIATGMAKDPDQRYATTVELASAARDAITVPLTPPSEPTLLADATRPVPPPAARQQPADLHLAATQQRAPGWAPVPQPGPADRPPNEPVPTTLQLWRRRQRLQVKLPFTGSNPHGLVVDTAGTVYVADKGNNRVVKLAVSSQSVLPFTGLNAPTGVAADAAGNLYVVDQGHRVLKLAAGSGTWSVIPFTGLTDPYGVAVDGAGNVYVTDHGTNRVVKLAADSGTWSVLPFTGLLDPRGVAVDGAGTVYVADSSNCRVLKLPAASPNPTTLPFTGLNGPRGVAVDTAGNVYVTDSDSLNNRVVKLASGASTPTTLPFTGLTGPQGVAVDAAGNVYVTDSFKNRVVKLRAG